MKPEDLQNEIALEDDGVWIRLEVKPGRWMRVRLRAQQSDEVQRAFRQATARFRVQLDSKKTDPESQAARDRAIVCRLYMMLRAAVIEIEDFDLKSYADEIFAFPPLDTDEPDLAQRKWGKLRTALLKGWEVWDQQAAEVLAEAGKGQPPLFEDA